MRETLGRDAASRHSLEPIVANRRGSLESLLYIAGLELDLSSRGAALLRCGVAPDAGEAVGLQLEPD